MMWYNSIYLAAMHSHSKRKIESFNKVTKRLEGMNTTNEQQVMQGFFTSIEGMLSTSEGREFFFRNFSSLKSEVSYLCELYNLVKNYAKKCMEGNYGEALKEVRKIKRILDSFCFDKEVKEGGLEKDSVEIEAREVVDSIFPLALRKKISEISEMEEVKHCDSSLFTNSEKKLLKKFTPVYKKVQKVEEIPKNLVRMPTLQFAKALKIPVTLGFFESLANSQKAGSGSRGSKGLRTAKTLYVKPVKNGYLSERCSQTPNKINMAN
eukprot:TRINITY_DN8591_c0_g1_i1.p1 TRINITY_DN8591_c0_g1~~TRINITY_DN8591_c0_g1_i1.p1  ORF type:complete len:265 (+),score=67.52 TRINITY_DN8591_c0_g1_i1:509-1303(+)